MFGSKVTRGDSQRMARMRVVEEIQARPALRESIRKAKENGGVVEVEDRFRELLAESGTSLVDAYMMACALDGIDVKKAREEMNPHGPDDDDKEYVSF